MNSVIDKVHNNIIEYSMISSGDSVVVGLSGGADSVMLLTALFELKDVIGYTLSAAHVNHGIRGSSADDDCKYCAELCDRLGIDFNTIYFDIPKIASDMKTSEENAGRIKRYEYFNNLSLKYGYNKIAVAHNMNDSVETVIINLIRGSSLNGLGGIKPVNTNVIRPLFNISRNEIEAYLSEKGITYRTDETNLTDDYTRNKVRNNILKQMNEINPSVVRTIFSNTKNFREDDEFITIQANDANAVTQSGKNIIVDKKILDEQHVAVKKRILLNAFQLIKGNLNNIEKKHLEILLGKLASGSTYNMPDGVSVSVSFDKIIFTKEKNDTEYFECSAYPNSQIRFSDQIVTLKIVEKTEFDKSEGLYVDYDKLCGNLTIRSKKNGDKFIPYGMTGSKKIKQLFSELKIPFVTRNKIPVLCDENEIVAVIPYRINDRYKIDKNTTKVLEIHLSKEN